MFYLNCTYQILCYLICIPCCHTQIDTLATCRETHDIDEIYRHIDVAMEERAHQIRESSRGFAVNVAEDEDETIHVHGRGRGRG